MSQRKPTEGGTHTLEAIHVLPFDKCLVSERNTRQPTVKEVTASSKPKAKNLKGSKA